MPAIGISMDYLGHRILIFYKLSGWCPVQETLQGYLNS